MRKILLLIILVLVSNANLLANTESFSKLEIVTTTSDIKNLIEIIGKQRVNVSAIVPPNLDAEEYQPKAQDLIKLKNAKIVFRVGVDYDLWFDPIVKRSQNQSIQKGLGSNIDCSTNIALLDVRGIQVSGTGGHSHGSGNPHYWLDPLNAEIITKTILNSLVSIDPSGEKEYINARQEFLDELRIKMNVWQSKIKSIQGKPIFAYHNNWAYFARRFRLNIAGYIEPKPGIPPSAAHLNKLISYGKSNEVKIIIRKSNESARSADFLAEKIGARVAILEGSVGANDKINNYFQLFDYNIAELINTYR
jgi:ABC-type Zn uptake system ZnuABC Zn-binding protein ZnuA